MFGGNTLSRSCCFDLILVCTPAYVTLDYPSEEEVVVVDISLVRSLLFFSLCHRAISESLHFLLLQWNVDSEELGVHLPPELVILDDHEVLENDRRRLLFDEVLLQLVRHSLVDDLHKSMLPLRLRACLVLRVGSRKADCKTRYL